MNTTQVVPPLDCYLEPGECEILRIVKNVIVPCTLLFTVVIVTMLIILRKYRSFSERIFLNLLIAETCVTIAYISGNAHQADGGTTSCILQGFFIQVFDTVVLMWVGALTLFLFLKLTKSIESEKYEWLYMAICWTIPVSVAVLPLTTNDYGLSSAPYCWITQTPSGLIWRFAIYWVPVFGGVIIILATFIYMHYKASASIAMFAGKQDPFEDTYKRWVKEYLKPLRVYAASFVIVHLVQFINRVYQAAADTPTFSLVVLHVICSSSFGMILCTMFLISNGRSEFTLDNFRNGLAEHKRTFTGRNDIIEEYEHGSPVHTLERRPPSTQV